MVTLRERGVSPSMAIDAGGVWPNPAARRGNLTSYKFRVREERKKVIRISNAKYRKIEDHESGLRRVVLIRNTLRRLQREAREEKLARHRALAANVSPSYLSASRPRSPSPPCDMQVSDVLNSVYAHPTPTPISALEEDDPMPLPKRPRLFLDDDKENDGISCESRLECDMEGKDESRMIVDDTQEILRDLYETYTGESLSQTTTTTPSRPSTPIPPRPDTPYTASYSCTLPSTSPSLATTNTNNNTSNGFNSTSNNNNNNNNSSSSSSINTSGIISSSGSSSYHDWSRPPQQQQYACGHASLLGNDLQSVVFHSLIASLES